MGWGKEDVHSSSKIIVYVREEEWQWLTHCFLFYLQDIFPRAYHTLVHCPIEDIFDTLLGLEQDYASLIQERYAQCEHELEEIQAR